MIDWDSLLHREGSAVWRTIYRIVRNQADADECFQETFLAALELSSRETVRNWPALLQQLATRRAVDRIRKRLRRKRLEEMADLTLAEAAHADPSQPAQAAELSNALRWALAQIPTRQADVFCLHELEDWSYQQISEQFGISVGAVGVILHRTRQKLQNLLKLQSRLSTVITQQRRM